MSRELAMRNGHVTERCPDCGEPLPTRQEAAHECPADEEGEEVDES